MIEKVLYSINRLLDDYMPDKYQIDDSRMPLRLGSALRVPSYAFENWGIAPDRYRKESGEKYEVEWKGGSKRQMDYVIESLKKAGMKNYSQMLRDTNAKLVAATVRRLHGKVKILEPGFGVSTINMFDALDNNDKDRVYITGLEPSEERGEDAAAELEKRGLKRDGDFEFHADINNHMLDYVGPESQNIICYVATFHHHSYIDTPLAVAYNALMPGGIITSSDWHNSMWEHPNRVYEFLKILDWERKGEDLEAFVNMFPRAIEPVPRLNSPDEMANEQIRMFWGDGWVPVREEAVERGDFEDRDGILMLGAQRPVERCQDGMNRIDFRMYTPLIRELYGEVDFTENPHQLLDNSRILMTITGQKPIG